MHSPPKEYNSVRINSESPTEAFDIVDSLRRDIVVIFNIALPLARFLFSITLLDSAVNWSDIGWTTIDWIALVPISWAIVSIILALTGQFRWQLGGRLMVVTDMLVSAVVIVFFPVYTLSALALAGLSLIFLILRRSGRLDAFLAIIPVAALLVRPLAVFDMVGADWPVRYFELNVAGEILLFLLSLSAVLLSFLTIMHISVVERLLPFQQPWREKFAVGLGKHNIPPVFDCIHRIYPGSKLVCILNSPNRREGKTILTSTAIPPSSADALRSQLTDYVSHGGEPNIVELDHGIQTDIRSGQRSPVPASFERMARGLAGLGFSDGVLFDFELGNIRGRMFFSTCTPIEETLRNDLITLTRQLERYFDDASKWDERRQEMMGLARDLARRDMHDGILQSLAALKMRLVTIISTPASISNPELDALRKTIDMITVEQTRLRSLLHDDEAGDESVNLVEMIEVCLKTLSLQWDISIKLASQEPALPVDRESAENIEHLVREIIANAIRHAKAKQLTFALALSQGDLMMSLKDDLNASNTQTNSAHAARDILASRSLSQRLEMVNGQAYAVGLEDSTLLAISIPMDFTEND